MDIAIAYNLLYIYIHIYIYIYIHTHTHIQTKRKNIAKEKVILHFPKTI